MKKKRISVSSELHQLALAASGLRLLASRLRDAPEDPESRDTGTAVASLLLLLTERLRLVERAVRGTIDPAVIWNRENDAEGLDEAVTLTSWETNPGGRARGRDGP
jgi:hypothetical protein